MHHAGDDSRPAGLVARAEAGPVVAVEVFVEQQAIAPVRVVLELLGPTVDGTPTVLVAQEHVGQSSRQGRSASRDRKSTRLNSSHDQISYAVFCLKKKKKKT